MPPTEDNKDNPSPTSPGETPSYGPTPVRETFLHPVYRTETGEYHKGCAGAANGAVVDAAIQTDHNGYRLPTSDEWNMAGRWRNTDSIWIHPGRRKVLTPGNYASGATDNYLNEEATVPSPGTRELLAHRSQDRPEITMPNHLGPTTCAEMSGNGPIRHNLCTHHTWRQLQLYRIDHVGYTLGLQYDTGFRHGLPSGKRIGFFVS